MEALNDNIQENSLEQTLKEISSLVSLPEVYLKFRQLMDNPLANIDEFTELVSCDPNLSSTVLKVANSAFFGFPGQVESIERALVMLGLGQLHDMVLATSAMESLNLPNEIVSLRTFWRSSLFTAALVRILAKQAKIKNCDSLFVIGLLHEIGHLIIYSRYPEQAKLALQRYQTEGQLIHQAEQDLLGFHYGQVGAMLMSEWQLPLYFQQITQFQPTPMVANNYPIETTLLHIAHGQAHQLYSKSVHKLDPLTMPDVLDTVEFTPDDLENAVATATQVCLELERAILK